MAHRTPHQRIASLLLGRDVIGWIAERRANGDTWPTVRDALRDATDGEVDVVWQALQQWSTRASYEAPASESQPA